MVAPGAAEFSVSSMFPVELKNFELTRLNLDVIGLGVGLGVDVDVDVELSVGLGVAINVGPEVDECVQSVYPIIFPGELVEDVPVGNAVPYLLLIIYICQTSSPSAGKFFPSEKVVLCSHCIDLRMALSDHSKAG